MPTGTQNNAAEDRPIRRRVRTGCQRCRIRRRKCDERKPVCSNCAERNFECQYGLQLRFPATTTRTVPQVETAPTAGYTQIRFVGDPEERTHSREPNSGLITLRHASDSSHTRSDSQLSTRSSQLPVGTHHASENSSDEATRQRQPHRHSTEFASPIYSDPFQFRVFPDPQFHTLRPTSTGHLEAGSAEHGAVQSLVSLATSVQSPFIFQNDSLSHGQVVSRPEDDSSQQDSALGVPTPASSSAITSNALAQPSTASTDEITEERGLELLRYYRYHVAPWLDMLDLDHHLGLYLPTVGAESPSAIYALYALSARHRELACGVPDMAQFESERFYNMSKWGTKAMYATDASDALEARMIRLIVDLISTPFSSWTPRLGQTVNSSTPLHAYAHKPGLAASLFWCIFRFDLAAALVNETHMTTDLDTLIALDRLPDGVLGVFENVGFDDNVDPACVDRYALRALLLCGEAVRVLQDYRQREAGDECPGRVRPQNHLVQWQNKWNELSAWYTNRRRFVKPLLELSSSAGDRADTNAFPTIIFSTAAATLANLVYHTAAMTLLDCKPKTLKVPGQHSPAASLHWHAQRTCAIAVSNASFENWDLCMIACVLRAARKMTHRDQQAAVLATLRLARETTGWKIDGDMQKLQEFWRLAEHS